MLVVAGVPVVLVVLVVAAAAFLFLTAPLGRRRRG